MEAHLRAEENLLVVANMRGESPELIAQKMFNETTVSGLQGPTVSPVIVRDAKQKWFSVSIVVRRADLARAITELRTIGGSGMIVSPVTYIFEEEPPRYKAMLSALQ
jgi:ATP phosphoribosyltransferase